MRGQGCSRIGGATSHSGRGGPLRSRILRALLLCTLGSALLGGCASRPFETLSYYGQAARGQFALLVAREPIPRVLARAGTPDSLRTSLQRVQAARAYAADRLGLPVGDRYASYVQLDRAYPVWNVFATGEFALTPHQWCYPIVGCAVYRGYFAERDALRYAASLRAQGLDVYVGGVPAYSTLGWFDDPVLSSFSDYPEADLVGLIFHETAHSLVFVPGDSRFNEGFATFVEEEGLRRWYAGRADDWARVRAAREQRRAFVAFVMQWRAQLAAVYASPLDDAAKRARKSEVFAAMAAAYRAGGTPFAGRYDAFFTAPPNNARLATFSTYYDRVPAFAVLLARVTRACACASDGGEGEAALPAFYAQVRALAALAPAERDRALDALGAEATRGEAP